LVPGKPLLDFFKSTRRSEPLGPDVPYEWLERLRDLIGDSLKTCHRSKSASTEVVDRAEEELFEFVRRLTREVERVEIIFVETTVRTEMTYRLSLMRVSVLNQPQSLRCEAT
jgi:hypothetical protein